MRLGLMLGYSGAHYTLPMDLVLEAERLGYHSAWTAEAWGSDAVTPVAWLLARTTRLKAGTAIMQLAGRTPACAAMTAMTLDQLSGGRFLCGLGPSGPQVVEGWHGERYGKPLTRLREYIEIVRRILAREAPLTYEGEHYQIPYRGPGASGLGKPLKSILHGNPQIPIYTAGISPNGLAVAGEIADGVIPVWMNPENADMLRAPIVEGFRRGGRHTDFTSFDLAPFVRVVLGADLEACRRQLKEGFALYIGGMGARGKNFYNDYARRLGYEAAAKRVQDLYLAGDKAAAAAQIPDRLIDECSLIGPAARIREHLAPWRDAARRGEVGTLIFTVNSVEALRLLAEELL
ncbi:MAG TPA: LLM class F420-dependent oxidoreductase [Gammaproteobacteria bacterium]|nr:LLM class F420-dependent oxidoreductase [Gammaproteobacteria bacterium]